ncbi:cardiolipin synthase [Peptostreptococcus sp.]|uniref:cardiolipin synthase n=1 Tax=Peptostreptococcus sp. TaxID=1262 RepID=UPI002FC5D9E3
MEERGRNSIGRAAIAALGFLLQVVWILFQVHKIHDYYPVTAGITKAIAILVVLRIYGKHTKSDIKIPWMVLLLVFPVAGLVFYILFQGNASLYFTKKKFRSIVGKLGSNLESDDELLDDIYNMDLSLYGQSHYISKTGGYPAYRGCQVEYHKDADIGIEAQKRELKKAKNFIFMEYHAIEDSVSFRNIEDILEKKVKEGVDVRIIYDDMGSVGFIGKSFRQRLKEKGIKCLVFNPMLPFLNVFMNNRDHRKITVIDGKVGFTGGYNLADRYFNIDSPYGYWKDTGMMIKGRAVDSFTVMFLEMWYAINPQEMEEENIRDYINITKENYADNGGIVQPYGENPLIEELLAENVYLNMAKNAKKYLYIMTPYLLIDDSTNDELVLAAKRGVDVRIITPGIPDKKLIYKMTRSYYNALARGGVKIYEYTPGFMHAKQYICDDSVAALGTINMDYRSLYLHFENGVLMYNMGEIAKIKEDFDDVLSESKEVTKDYLNDKRSLSKRIIQCLLRFFAPLL